MSSTNGVLLTPVCNGFICQGLGNGLKGEPMDDRVENLKRQACHIASQLPDDRRDALCILNYAREILFNLGVGWETPSALGVIRIADRQDRGAN